MREIIKVKQEHINKGVRLSSDKDPIALAIMDTGIFDEVHVGATMISVKVKYYYDNVLCLTPRSVLRFIQAFDVGKKVKPFNFLLNNAVISYKENSND